MNRSKLMNTALSVVLSLCLLASFGCKTRMGNLTLVSSRNVGLDKVDLDKLPQVRGVTGKGMKFIFLFIPFGRPHLKDAIEDALDKGGGDVMVDVAVYQREWWFIVGEYGFEVKGSVIKTRGESK